jgi:hypothetical protein
MPIADANRARPSRAAAISSPRLRGNQEREDARGEDYSEFLICMDRIDAPECIDQLVSKETQRWWGRCLKKKKKGKMRG